jgi:hypothetical protein
MGQGPIFIGGLGRSGKTWLRFILSSHPTLAAFSRRTNLWTRHYKRYGDLKQRPNFERCLAALLESKHVQALNPNVQRIRQEFWQGKPTYERLFALLHEHYAQACRKPRWGDQTELIEACADEVFAAYPDAKMIHLVRDPRDRYEAVAARSKQTGRAGDATARWLYSVRLAQRNSQRYPDRYMIVRYENLAAQPEETVAAVCHFLDEEYVPEMLLMKDVPRFQKRGLEGRSPLNAEYIGAYRAALSDQEIALIQNLAGREMSAFGYALEPLNTSIGERLSLTLVKAPTSYLRTLLWRALLAGNP